MYIEIRDDVATFNRVFDHFCNFYTKDVTDALIEGTATRNSVYEFLECVDSLDEWLIVLRETVGACYYDEEIDG